MLVAIGRLVYALNVLGWRLMPRVFRMTQPNPYAPIGLHAAIRPWTIRWRLQTGNPPDGGLMMGDWALAEALQLRRLRAQQGAGAAQREACTRIHTEGCAKFPDLVCPAELVWGLSFAVEDELTAWLSPDLNHPTRGAL